MPTTLTLGQAIQEARRACDKTLRDLAKQIGVAPSFISDIENSKRNPSEAVLRDIAEAVGRTYDQLKQFDTRVDADFKEVARQVPEVAVLMRRIQNDPALAKKVLAQLDQLRSPSDR